MTPEDVVRQNFIDLHRTIMIAEKVGLNISITVADNGWIVRKTDANFAAPVTEVFQDMDAIELVERITQMLGVHDQIFEAEPEEWGGENAKLVPKTAISDPSGIPDAGSV